MKELNSKPAFLNVCIILIALLICGFLTGMLVLWYQEPMEDKTFGNDCAGIEDSKTLMKKVKLKAAGATSVSDMLLTDICN